MAEFLGNICKFNQSGSCKFQEHCQRKHENRMCENLSECTKDECQKRHPKICRNFSKNKKCRFKDECAYLQKWMIHRKKLFGQMTLLLFKHEKDNTALNEEVSMLKSFIQAMAVEVVKSCHKEMENSESTEKN